MSSPSCCIRVSLPPFKVLLKGKLISVVQEQSYTNSSKELSCFIAMLHGRQLVSTRPPSFRHITLLSIPTSARRSNISVLVSHSEDCCVYKSIERHHTPLSADQYGNWRCNARPGQSAYLPIETGCPGQSGSLVFILPHSNIADCV